jgi:hypothetical protein
MMRKLVAVVALVCGCSPPESDAPVKLGSFEAQIDFESGQLLFRPLDGAGQPVGDFQQGLMMIPDVQNGVAGSGPDNTVELVTTSVGQGVAGCNRANSFCGVVTMNSFFTTSHLQNVWVELTYMAPATGYTAYNSSPGAPAGVLTTYGDWSYGTLPGYKSSSTVTWGFNYPSAGNFRFRGDVQGNIIGGATGATLTVAPTSGYAGEQVTLNGSNFGSDTSANLAFDSTSLGSVAVSGGAFMNKLVNVPTGAAALAGNHQFTATGVPSGAVATASFTVNAWNQVVLTGAPTVYYVGVSGSPASYMAFAATNLGQFHSTNGTSWGTASGPTNVSALSGNPVAGIGFFSCTDGTAYQTGGGTTWNKMPNPSTPPDGVMVNMSARMGIGPFGASTRVAGANSNAVMYKALGPSGPWVASNLLGPTVGTTSGTSVAWGSGSNLFLGASGTGGGIYGGTGSQPMLSSLYKVAGFTPTNVSALATSAGTGTPLWVGTSSGTPGLYKGTIAGVNPATMNGGTWTNSPIGGGLGNTSINTIAVDPGNNNNVWVGTAQGIYMTKNGGTTWSFSGLGSGAVKVLAAATSTTVFAVTPSGLYFATNGGQ